MTFQILGRKTKDGRIVLKVAQSKIAPITKEGSDTIPTGMVVRTAAMIVIDDRQTATKRTATEPARIALRAEHLLVSLDGDAVPSDTTSWPSGAAPARVVRLVLDALGS